MATTAELIQGILDSKADIIAAIRSKGSEVPEGAKLAALSAIIDTITTERWDEATVKGLVSGTWDESVTAFEFPAGIARIKNYAFYQAAKIKNIVVPEGVTSIGQNAFYWSKMEQLTLPTSIKSVGNLAFYGCEFLEEFIVPDGVDGLTFGTGAFQYMKKCKKFYFGEGTKSIGGYSMQGSEVVIDVYVPSTMTSIGSGGLRVRNTSANIHFEKTMADTQAMSGYPWQIIAGCTIHCTDGDLTVV